MISSVGRNDLARWQFCSTTQKPSAAPSSIHFCAMGPCPWPSDTVSTRVPRSSANLSSPAMGSLPADSTKMSGVVALESLKEGSMEKGVGSTKRLPSVSPT